MYVDELSTCDVADSRLKGAFLNLTLWIYAHRNKKADQSEEDKNWDADADDKIRKILTENPGRKPRWSDDWLQQASPTHLNLLFDPNVLNAKYEECLLVHCH